MEVKETLERKIRLHEKDLKVLLRIGDLVDRIYVANLKVIFQDLIAEQIMVLSRKIQDIKDYLEKEFALEKEGEE